jgi:hypothetical protein
LSGSDADSRPLAAVHVAHVGEGRAVGAEARTPGGRLAEGGNYRVEVFLEGRNRARKQREVSVRRSGSCVPGKWQLTAVASSGSGRRSWTLL